MTRAQHLNSGKTPLERGRSQCERKSNTENSREKDMLHDDLLMAKGLCNGLMQFALVGPSSLSDLTLPFE